MPAKTAAEKMRLNSGMRAAFLHAPEGVQESIGVPEGITITDDAREVDFILVFATSQAEAEERLLAVKPSVHEKTLAWLAYPKGSRAAGRDLNRDTIWAYGRTIGLDFVANIALDETWSAMRMRPAKSV
jgi:hypothetical protein